MVAQAISNGDKALRRVAASYRKQGYRVVAPPKPGALPSFLQDCQPDLIAERDDDRVVVEIKPTGSLKGANDLVALAEKVAAQPGWRLELVTFKNKDADASVVSADWLESKLAMPTDVAICIFRTELLEVLLRSLAALEGIRIKHKSGSELAHELAFEGAIEGDLVAKVDAALQWRSDLLHDKPISRPAAEQAIELDALCRAVSALQHDSED